MPGLARHEGDLGQPRLVCCAVAEVAIDGGDPLALMARQHLQQTFKPLAAGAQPGITVGVERPALQMQDAHQRLHAFGDGHVDRRVHRPAFQGASKIGSDASRKCATKRTTFLSVRRRHGWGNIRAVA